MRKLIIPLLLIMLPTVAFAVSPQVDFTKTVEENSMLIILFLLSAMGGIGLFAKILWDRIIIRLDDKNKRAEQQEEKVIEAELMLKQQEISALRERTVKLESACYDCQKLLPLHYITKVEFEKFVERYREDSSSTTSKLEAAIKDLKVELKNDMQENINRIIGLLNEIVKK